MAEGKDKETPKEGEKRVDVEATADVSDETGKTHEVGVEATATVTDLRSKQTSDEGEAPACIECGTPLMDGRCINANCSIAQQQNTKGADRPTAKATAPAPRAVSAGGRVD